MKLLRFILLLTFVVILVKEESVGYEHCNQKDSIIKHQDGSYERIWEPAGWAVYCGPLTTTSIEEWTDYPDNGGEFIRKILNPPNYSILNGDAETDAE